jgi:hypothetical protein
MAVPWLRLIDTGIGLVNYARGRRTAIDPVTGTERLEPRPGVFGALENRLAGVVVAALREAFDRDARRLDLEREQLETERLRAERVLKLELLRQAAEREIGRLRLLAGVAAASFLGTLFLAPRVIGGAVTGRILLGLGWALLLAALGFAFTAQSKIEDTLQREAMPSSDASATAPWLIVGALAFIAVAALVA